MFITRYYKTGSDANSRGTEPLHNPAVDLKQMLKDKASKAGEPRFWGFSEWGSKHNREGFVNAYAVALEYRTTADSQAIERAVIDLGFHCMAFNTEAGRIYVFPLSNPTSFGGYTKVTAVLAECIGLAVTNGVERSIGMVVSSGSPTYLFEPSNRPYFVEYAGNTFDMGFLEGLGLGNVNLSVWSSDKTTLSPKVSVTVDGSNVREQLESSAKRSFDDLFDALELTTNNTIIQAQNLKAQLTDIRKQMGGSE
jgi:hypothetical protein